MDAVEFGKMTDALRASARRYPTCRIANCDCNDYVDEWKPGCGCMGHFKNLDKAFGEDGWALSDFSASVKTGMPTRATKVTP